MQRKSEPKGQDLFLEVHLGSKYKSTLHRPVPLVFQSFSAFSSFQLISVRLFCADISVCECICGNASSLYIIYISFFKMSDSDSEKLDEAIIDNMSKLSKKRPRSMYSSKAKGSSSGTAALLNASNELSPSDIPAASSAEEERLKRSRKNRRTHITSEKYGIGRFVGLHTPVQMRSRRNADTKKQEEKRRMCVVCFSRVYTMCKECNTAVCFANTFENVEQSCWYQHHHEPSLVPIPSSLQATL